MTVIRNQQGAKSNELFGFNVSSMKNNYLKIR